MNKTVQMVSLGLAISITLSGCLNVPQGKDGKSYQQLQNELNELRAKSEASQSQSRIKITNGPLATNQKIPLRRYPWLSDKRVNLNMGGKKTLNGRQIVEMLHDEGLNITTVLPLESFTYAGYGFSGVDAESALRLIFPAMGLDYSIDNERRIVTIVPMRSKTWVFNINPQRSSSFTSSSVAGSLDAAASLTSSLNSGSNGLGGGSSALGAGNTNGGTSEGQTNRQGDSKIESKSDFWKSIKEELEMRVTVLVPIAGGQATGSTMPAFGSVTPAELGAAGLPNLPLGGSVPIAAPAAKPSGGEGGDDIYRAQKLGRVAVNPDTGAITVQGPQWLIAEIDEYLQGVKREFSTAIQFEGRLLLVSTTKENSEGLDLSAFATLAGGDLGMIINNSAAGGITISPPSTGVPPVITPGSTVVGNTRIAFSKLTGNPANVFINYLESIGDVSVKQRPVLSTTSGTPAEFSRMETDLMTILQQNAVAGTNGSSGQVGTQNLVVPIKFGTLLRVNPKIDLASGLVRTQITLNVAVRSNVKTIDQYITDVNGTQKIPQQVTLPSNIDYNGETLLRDGDTIIIGGQVEESDEDSGSGVTGYDKAGPFAGLIGSTKRTKRVQTYYLVMTARVYSRG
ncbi:hypothetical protein [Pseudomonas aeruginosa]|uniref:hypothetical protein n=1 Tax=Pseudomonas aeruginosa TaxID=287 RepID=UPI0003D33117|nr:hypothetical protein [Pseudomonas aeruginosa]ELT7041076.1 hypothetical protein [Pseudomonas aeruginosa]ETD53106.1 hypothetical protein X778_12795 [Pseudomonas aeruginosa VRFPA07]KAA5588825.1 pilus assembly protein MshL [Pseudomonas aeruginosa]MBG6418222.1 hypothetical protein [Pseudomonas aeruginosa]MBH8810437.1 hypothetical protein [Pseudomonas aeruginosa]